MADFLSWEMVPERDWADAKVSIDTPEVIDRKFNARILT
jgi:hypothetical protein